MIWFGITASVMSVLLLNHVRRSNNDRSCCLFHLSCRHQNAFETKRYFICLPFSLCPEGSLPSWRMQSPALGWQKNKFLPQPMNKWCEIIPDVLARLQSCNLWLIMESHLAWWFHHPASTDLICDSLASNVNAVGCVLWCEGLGCWCYPLTPVWWVILKEFLLLQYAKRSWSCEVCIKCTSIPWLSPCFESCFPDDSVLNRISAAFNLASAYDRSSPSVKILFFLSASCIQYRVHSCMHVILLIRNVSLRWYPPVSWIRPVSNTAFILQCVEDRLSPSATVHYCLSLMTSRFKFIQKCYDFCSQAWNRDVRPLFIALAPRHKWWMLISFK